MHAIAAVNLRKVYRTHQKEPGLRGALRDLFQRRTIDHTAVDGLSFTIEEGEFVGFLGPNGAGKTTTLKMLSGLLVPSAGSATVLGHTPARREPAFLRQIALVMGQKGALDWDLPALETLLLHKELYRLPDRVFRATVEELTALLLVGDLLRVPVRKLSLGERMKLELFAALVHRPRVLFLDEPTIGLDVVAAQRVRDFLRDLNRAHGTTILLTSHAMDDIEALCPRVLVIDGGSMRFDGPLSRLVAQADPHKVLTVVFDAPVDADALAAVVPSAQLRASDDPHRLCLAIPREEVGATTAQVLGLGRVLDVSIAEPPIEDVMREMFISAQERSAT